MIPSAKIVLKKDRCGKKCPYLNEYVHPFSRHSCWCSHLHKELFWYDGWWTAKCIFEQPDEKIQKYTEYGGQYFNPKYERKN